MTTKTRVAALAASLAFTVASLSGCQWLASQASPSLPPATASPNPTPPESAQEREMRADQEAAIKAYTAANKEVDRLGMAGGASKPTAALLATTGGFYLEVQMDALKMFKKEGWRVDRHWIHGVEIPRLIPRPAPGPDWDRA